MPNADTVLEVDLLAWTLFILLKLCEQRCTYLHYILYGVCRPVCGSGRSSPFAQRASVIKLE